MDELGILKEKLELRVTDEREVPQQFHQNIELLFVLSGELHAYVGQEEMLLRKDDILVINSNRQYRLHADAEVLYVTLSIQWQMVSDVLESTDILFWCNPTQAGEPAYGELQLALKHLLTNYLAQGMGVVNFRHISLCYQIMDILTKNFLISKADKVSSEERSAQEQYDDRIAQINQYIRDNYHMPISLNEMADYLHLSVGYLSRFFKKNFGVNFSTYVEDTRLHYATEELLYSDKSITRIVFDNGFPSVAAFDRSFKKKNGISPSEMRKSKGSQEKSRAGRGIYSEGDARHSQKISRELESYVRQEEIPAPTREQNSERLEIDAETAAAPLKAVWMDTLNIGAASDLLRGSVQNHIKYLRDQLHFRYVRFWNPFSEEMLLREPGPDGLYNFSRLNAVLDFLVQENLLPHIELGRKPRRIMRNVRSNIMEEGSGKDTGNTEETLLLEPEILHETLRHLARRYGDRLDQWRFELWFPETLWDKEGIRKQYLELFSEGYQLIRRYTASAQIGGCGLRLNRDNEENRSFLQKWGNHYQRPDFVSTSLFSYEQGTIEGDALTRRSTDNDVMRLYCENFRRVLRETGMEHIPFYVTEWNLTISDRNRMNDSCFKGAYIVRNMIALYGMADLIAYFYGTDRVVEHYDSSALLFGGSGLLTESGIAKPAALAYMLLNRLYPNYVQKSEHALVSTDGRGSYGILCHNQKLLGSIYFLTDEDKMDKDEMWKYFEDLDKLNLHIVLHGARDGKYRVRVFRVNERNGSIADHWKKMEFDMELSGNDVRYLMHSSTPQLQIRKEETRGGELELQVRLDANEFDYVEIRPEME